ncbi:hypothetical protein Hdeb2414_s0003g00102691 [Helianthus debilis subsp. tardiflorus]
MLLLKILQGGEYLCGDWEGDNSGIRIICVVEASYQVLFFDLNHALYPCSCSPRIALPCYEAKQRDTSTSSVQ